MNSVRTTHSHPAEEHTSVDRSLLEYLKPKPCERYSRIEAYCDLLARAATSPYSAKCAGQQIDLLPGQCVLTISDLARKWQWQRATVRQFLDGLVALGLLEAKPFVKSYVITIRQQSCLSLTVHTKDDILDFSHLLFARYLLGRSSLEEVARSYGTYYEIIAAHGSGQADEDAATKRISQHQILQFHHLMTMLAILASDKQDVPANLADSLRLLFGRDHQWNWQEVMTDLGIMSSAFKEHTKPSQLAEAKAAHGEAELVLLDSIHAYYMTVFPAIASDDGSDNSIMPHGGSQGTQHEDLTDSYARTSETAHKPAGASIEDKTPTSVCSAS